MSEPSTCFACSAGVAQLVEHHLAKVDVESSSLFARSILGKPPEMLPAAFLRFTLSNSDFEAVGRRLGPAFAVEATCLRHEEGITTFASWERRALNSTFVHRDGSPFATRSQSRSFHRYRISSRRRYLRARRCCRIVVSKTSDRQATRC